VRLKTFERIAGFGVLRDGGFATPGLLADPQPEMLVFVESRKVVPLLLRTRGVACAIATEEVAGDLDPIAGLAVAPDPRRAFWELHNHLASETSFYWDDFSTSIDRSARIHPRAWVAEKNVRIGADTIVEANAVVSERSLIGTRVTLRAGVVLGSAGFQTARSGEDLVELIHAGGIEVQDGVEIFANAVIARAIFRQFTTIGRGSRIGNLAFVSHNVRIGPHCFVGHGSVINGNVTVGSDAWIGPGATISHCLVIGERAKVSLGAAVLRDVPPGQRVTGSVAVEHRKMLRHIAALE
jgi:UDP-3-O-[3-hydroxymyristoyl] glucosamine N-acyltransferase